MFRLIRHIQYLLTEHNCVIVPQLGGFVAHYVAAKPEDASCAYLPPLRSVAFNPQLTLNDGLLVQSYMQTCGGSYNEGLRLMERDVRELKEALLNPEGYELFGIGHLSLTSDGRYHFEPQQTGLVTPALYWLNPIKLVPLAEQAEVVAGAKPRTHFARFMKNENEYTITISRDVANYVAAAIVALVFYLAWAVPGHRDKAEPQQASVAAKEVTAKQKPVATKVVSKPAEEPAQQQIRAEKPAASAAEAAAPQTAPVQQSAAAQPKATDGVNGGTFAIVLATGVPEESGAAFVKKLIGEGYREARMVTTTTGRRQIVYGRFTSNEQARARLAELRSTSYFQQSWVTQVAN